MYIVPIAVATSPNYSSSLDRETLDGVFWSNVDSKQRYSLHHDRFYSDILIGRIHGARLLERSSRRPFASSVYTRRLSRQRGHRRL